MDFWHAPRLWPGETCFIVGGGPSVADIDLEQLRGRRTLVVNASFKTIPWADVLFFGDTRFWSEHRAEIDKFKGMIVTASLSARTSNIKRLRKIKQPGLAVNPFEVFVQWTSVAGAISLAAHFGVARIVGIGWDGGPDGKGRTHYHKPHPWPQKPDCWEKQRAELETLAGPLRKRGIDVINCSPKSRIDFWPRMTLDDYLCAERSAASGTKHTIKPISSSPDLAEPASASA